MRKAWLYLDEMREGMGQLTYAPGSHRQTQERLLWEREVSVWAAQNQIGRRLPISLEDLAGVGAVRGVRRFDVPANTLIAAYTFGFHARAASRGPTMRVEIYASSAGVPSPCSPVPGWRTCRVSAVGSAPGRTGLSTC